jgi:basic membrane protein A
MMKRVLAILLAVIFAFGMTACGGAQEEESAAPETYEIAMITDIGTIDDKSFNQGTWEGVEAFATENGKTCKYYKPTEQTTDAYLAAIQLAVEGGAQIIVTPGFLFEEPIYLAQDLYEDVNFVLIDGYPHNADYTEYRTEDNAVGIIFAEEQVGYLAGYAAVKDGFTKLGYMGGMAVPAVVRYGYGFVQGAEAAAAELGIPSIDLMYHYTGDFVSSPENQAKAASWYAGGTEVIFAAGGAVGNSVMSAAEAVDAKVIGVDVDQSGESPTVIVSAMKGLGTAVQTTLGQFYEGKFPGGESLIYDAAMNGVSLSMDSAKFTKFAQADYDAVFAKLAAGEITLTKDVDAGGNAIASPVDLGAKIVKVNFVE